jgi:hypothetical protein
MSQGRIKLLIAGIVSLLLLSSFSCWRIFRDGWRIDAKIETYLNHNNSKERIQELILFITESGHLTSSWIFLPEDIQGKNKLVNLHTAGYPELRKNVESVIESWDDIQKKKVQSLLFETDTLVSEQKKAIDLLLSFEDYEDAHNPEAAKGRLLNHVIFREKTILNELTIMRENLDLSTRTAWDESRAEIESADEVSLLLSILMFISGILGLIIIITGIFSPDKSMI